MDLKKLLQVNDASKQTARKLLKGSAAFTTALLFGTRESQGLIRTVSAATVEAFSHILKSPRQRDFENALHNHEEKMRARRSADDNGMNPYTGRFSHEIDKYYESKE